MRMMREDRNMRRASGSEVAPVEADPARKMGDDDDVH